MATRKPSPKRPAKKSSPRKAPARKSSETASGTKAEPSKVVLLSGGNPQIPKGDGDGPVQAYLAAMPGWKKDIGRQLDSLIVRTLPKVKKAIRWNSPFYGMEGNGWFLSFHCFNKYVKVTFLNGSSLSPLPPIESKHPATRYIHVSESEPLDEKSFVKWIKQAAKLPGDALF